MTRLAAENPDRAQVAALGGLGGREQVLGYARMGLYSLARFLGAPDPVAGELAAQAVAAFAEATVRRLEAPGVDVVGVEVR